MAYPPKRAITPSPKLSPEFTDSSLSLASDMRTKSVGVSPPKIEGYNAGDPYGQMLSQQTRAFITVKRGGGNYANRSIASRLLSIPSEAAKNGRNVLYRVFNVRND